MTQLLNSFLSSTQELRQISGKVRQLRAIQLHFEKIAPPSLLRSTHVLNLEHGILALAANNGAVAAKLRQMTPELTKQLQLRGCEVTVIQVRVQVTLPPDKKITTPASISEQSKQQLHQFAESIGESPLKNALLRLADNRKNK